MSRSSKAWHYFVCFNFSAVSKDRVGLIYAIQMGKSIDVGLIIQKSILKALKILKAGLPHPHLVFELCKAPRVQWVEGEELLHPNGAIDNKNFDVYKNYVGSSIGAIEYRPSTRAKLWTPT